MSFFKYPEYTYNANAAAEIVPVVINLLHPKSVIDIGCGTGTWLSLFKQHGITDITGVDHPQTDFSLLKISKDKFIPADLSKPYRTNRKYDLVVSLEVAEHLSAAAADTYVETLVALGDVILFSAAIPYQGGEGHVNEQWPQYWMNKFGKHGYGFNDSIRQQVWLNSKVEWWYRQNIFLVINNRNANLPLKATQVLPMVHPEHYLSTAETLQNTVEGRAGIRKSFGILIRALRRRINKN